MAMKPGDQEAQPHLRIDADQRRHQGAGEAGERGADDEARAHDHLGIDAEARRRVGPRDHGPGEQAEPGALEDPKGHGDQSDGDRHQDQPIGRVDEVADGDAGVDRRGDAARGRAERQHDQLLQRDRQAPGGEDRVQSAPIDVAHQQDLDGEAGGADDDRRGNDGEPERRAGAGDGDRRVGAEHKQLAMGHVDDPHHAEHDNQPERHQDQDQHERAHVEQDDGDVGHHPDHWI